MIFYDYDEIESIKFSHPELFAPDIEEKAKTLFYDIKNSKKEIISLREKATKLEEVLKEKESIWSELLNAMDITYRTYEKEVTKNDMGIYFKMGADIDKNLH